MSKIAHHIALLIAVASIMMVSCQKEVSGGVEGIDSTAVQQKLSKAYYWYNGDTTDVPDYVDTIQYNGDQLSKVTRLGLFGNVPEIYDFQYRNDKKINKIVRRVAGDGHDYMFHYASSGRLDSLVVYEVTGGTGLFIRNIALEYAGDELRKVYSYDGDARVINDSVRYYRSNGKLDSFSVYHLGGVGGPPEFSTTKLNSTTVNISSYSDIISSGYIFTHSYDYELSVYFDMTIQQFLNPKDLIFRNLNTYQLWLPNRIEEDLIYSHYTFTPSNLVRTLVVEYVQSGGSGFEAFKFEYLK